MGPADTLALLILRWLGVLGFIVFVVILFTVIYRTLGWLAVKITRTKE